MEVMRKTDDLARCKERVTIMGLEFDSIVLHSVQVQKPRSDT